MSTISSAATYPRREGVVLAIVLTGFVASTYGFGVYLFANLVVDMRRDLGFDYTTVGIITGAAQAGFLLFSFVTSYLSRFLAGWKISLYSTALTTLALLGLSVTPNVMLAGLLLIILGGCSASVYIPLAEIVATRFAPHTRARVMGLISSGTSYGVFINGLLVSSLMASAGWRSVWLCAGSLSLVVCLLAWYLLRNTGGNAQGASSQSAAPAQAPGQPWVTRPLVMLWAIAFLNGLTLLPFQTYLAPFMRDELGISVSDAGLVWSTIGAVGMASGFLVGWVADRIGTRAALALCFTSSALACTVVYAQGPAWSFFVAAFLFAMAFYPIFGLVPTYIGQVIPVSRLTQAFGIANVLIGVGGVCGNFLGGWCKDLTGSFVSIYLIVGLLLVLQLLITLGLPKRHCAQVGGGQ